MDLEKVISGLKCHVNLKCHNCPYVDAIHPAYGCHLEELIADALALLKKQEQKWISVEDRLPEIRHAVLAYNPFHKNIWAVSMHEDGEWYYWIPSTKKYDPDWQGPITHWMPMPKIPDDQKVNGMEALNQKEIREQLEEIENIV